MKQPYKLALDLGTNSIGWCAFDLKKDIETERLSPQKIRKMGDKNIL